MHIDIGKEAETMLGHSLLLQSDAQSTGGKTLVTLTVDGSEMNLFPAEARALADAIKIAANRAAGC